MLRSVLCVGVLLLAGSDRAVAHALQVPCAPAVDDVIWIQEALDVWENVG